ncbi:hypothetical protein [Halalkalibacter krulwichiae]|uniref:Uncharacterized protein n=1 Tax=Halalkalibacter krulwichiae TaxID=199441 RepID=A0A1X9MB97_9BACI|nr:hypothetical protein [Halalkalibacter krulwichiae]ARK30697.1 hypothetical protein BkAM31D_13125 [Halalkalibacter krulwichiae]
MLKRTYERQNELKKAMEDSGIELKQFMAIGLEKVNVKSKKKRIRQKALKKALSQKEVVKDILLTVEGDQGEKKQASEKENIVPRNDDVTVRGLPVTFLLKLGKKFLKEEDVVRFYYNADKDEFYKNKQLLEDVVENQSKKLEHSQFAAFQVEVKAELEKRAKK